MPRPHTPLPLFAGPSLPAAVARTHDVPAITGQRRHASQANKASRSERSSHSARRHASLATNPSPREAYNPINDAYIRRYRPADLSEAAGPQRVSCHGSSEWRVHHYQAAAEPPSPLPPHKRSRLALEAAWMGGTDEQPHFDRVRKDQQELRTALLFPGSGSQYSGMGSTLLEKFSSARQVWEEAEEALAGFERWRKGLELDSIPELQDLKLLEWPSWVNEREPSELRKLVFGGRHDLLTRSSNAQPAILITSMAFLRTLETEFETPVSQIADFVSGHSSGEFSAAVAAGALSFGEAVRLTRLLGLLSSRNLYTSQLEPSMNIDAPPEHRANMSALVINAGHTHDEVATEIENLRKDPSCGLVEVASYNSAAQIVLAGSRAGVLCASDRLTELGIAARAADLPIAAPFHCSFMHPCAVGMRAAIDRGNIQLKSPKKPIVSSVNAGLVDTPDEVRAALVDGINRPVMWDALISRLRGNEGVGRMIFCGPGKALANMARKDQERGNWGKDSAVDIGSVATLDDLARVKDMFAS